MLLALNSATPCNPVSANIPCIIFSEFISDLRRGKLRLGFKNSVSEIIISGAWQRLLSKPPIHMVDYDSIT